MNGEQVGVQIKSMEMIHEKVSNYGNSGFEQNDKTNIKLPFISKAAYGMGDVGCNFSWMFVGNFLMIFYTDVFGIAMSAVAGLMLLSRVWDAVNDPIIGALSDRTHTRWGRFRPWLLIAAPLTAIVLVLTFWAHPAWSETEKIIYMAITYCTLVLGYTCVNIPYGTLCGAMTQNMEERAQINTFRSVSAMIAIGVINIITVPLITKLGQGNPQQGYLLIAILYGSIFTACHFFCFAKTKEVVAIPKKQKLAIKTQLRAVLQNKVYLIAVAGQFLFGLTLYGRNADALYYFTYVEGDQFATYSLCIIVPSIIGAACFPVLFKWTQNKGRAAAIFSFLTGISMFGMYFFSVQASPLPFYALSCVSQFFFSGFNTAIYAIIPDCVEYGEWKTGIRNDGFQYAFISLGNKIGMAIGTAVLAAVMGMAGYVANAQQNPIVISVIKNAFTTVPGILWIITAAVLLLYGLDKKMYQKIVTETRERKAVKHV
jgi:sugar (glycoside-pentoside-hexuronide) transporter